jgi:hypothetical protein
MKETFRLHYDSLNRRGCIASGKNERIAIYGANFFISNVLHMVVLKFNMFWEDLTMPAFLKILCSLW